MAKQKKTPRETPSSADSAPKPKSSDSQTARLDAVEVNAPLISSEVGATIVPSQMEGSYLTVDSRMDSSDITVIFLVKEAPELVFHDIVDSSGESGARRIAIPLHYLTTSMGFTLLISYKGRASGQPAASLVKEVGISFYPASESKNLAPYLLHEETVNSTPTYNMKDHTGDETVLVPVPPLAKAGDKVYCTAVTEQDAIPYVFYTVIYGHVLSPEEAVDGYVLKFFIARGWLARRKPWRSITLQCAWITSSLAAEPPAEVDPRLETRLPRNALEIQHRRTAALIVDPGIENLPPPHLQQSVFYNDEWCLNPELTRDGGDVDASNLDTHAGDSVCFFVRGSGNGRKPLGCVAIAQDGDRASVKLPACTVACFFNKPMTLSYTLAFGESELPSPDRVVNVLVPQFPSTAIEEATNHTVDLGTFSGDATATVPAWAYSECSKLCWMWVTGKGEDGRDLRFDLLRGAPVTDDWKARGVETPLSRVDLQKLADCSDFELHFAASFCEASNLVDAQEFLVGRFTIQQAPLMLPAPKVTQAVGDDLTVWNGRNGVDVEVDYVGNNTEHSISVCWQKPDGTCWPLASKPGSAAGAVIFALPREAVIESMGKTVKINYTVTSACKVQTSADLNLKISAPVRLPTPVVPEATPPAQQGGILDLASFFGDASITVEPWWFALEGKRVWLKCTGIKKNGSSYTFYVLSGRQITLAEVNNGLVEVISRAELALLKHDTPLVVTCIAAPDDGEHESDAIVFPVLNLIIKKPLICEVERFEELALGTYRAGNSIQTPLMKITFQQGSGTAGIVRFRNNEYYSGQHYGLCIECDHQIPPQEHLFEFTHALEQIRYSWSWKQRPATATFYDEDGEVVEVKSYPDDWYEGFWVEHTTPPGTAFKWMKIVVQDYSFLDNFSACYRA